jgi:PAS domain S-box-containing protein
MNRLGLVVSAELLAEAVVDTVHESLLVLDSTLHVKLANRSFYSTFEVSPEQTQGRPIYDLGTGQWDLPPLKRLLEELLPEDKHFYDFEVAYQFPTSGHRVMLLNARKLQRRPEQEELILLAIEDITERRNTEHLRRSNNELSEFAYTVAHDLQTPLRIIKGYAELLGKTSVEQPDAEANELIACIVNQASAMQELVSSLLKYALTTASTPSDERPVPLQAICDRVFANLLSTIKDVDVNFTYDPLPTVVGSPTQLLQLFQNLASNSFKYRRQGIAARIHVGVTEDSVRWIFAFQDNGIGIAPENYERIFLPTKRLNGPEIPGSGLGLAICRKVIEKHRGNIWVESQLGVGTTFYFSLPKQTPSDIQVEP